MDRKPRIYLDYAASTPVDPMVLRAMQPYFGAKFGNPGSLHSFGQEAINGVDRARETIARAIGVEFREIIFTASATEANNLALRGFINSQKIHASLIPPRIIISAIEHESILETARSLERDGVEVVYLPVSRQGIVDLKKLKASLNNQTVLVSIMYANNEIGTIQPIAEIAKIVHEFKSSIIFHTDAAQALQFLDCNVQNLGVDMMTLSAHKIYGPKGAGALYRRGDSIKRDRQSPVAALQSLLYGGGQEFGIRSGTENVPAIVGFAKAMELICADQDGKASQAKQGKKTKKDKKEREGRARQIAKIAKLRDELWRGIKKSYPKAEINGISAPFIGTLPNILNVHFPGHTAQDLLTKFDLNGLAVSSGSACRARATERSYVIEALGKKQGIRFSLGRPTKKEEIAAALQLFRRCFVF